MRSEWPFTVMLGASVFSLPLLIWLLVRRDVAVRWQYLASGAYVALMLALVWWVTSGR